MSVKPYWVAMIAGLSLATCGTAKADKTQAAKDQAARTALVDACKGKDGWSDAAPPARVFGNTYMVGTCGIVSLLITTPKGHILIDGATAEAAPHIAENIRTLGFDPKDVKFLLATHEHIDHVGGLAELKRITGARFFARAEAKAAMETGKPDATDPQLGSIPDFEGIPVDEVMEDLGDLYFGKTAITLLATPGHTPGSSSWTWRSCEGKTCHKIVYADSLSAVSADSYRFTDHPKYVATMRATIDKVSTIKPCDILITPHPSASRFFERLSGAQPLVNSKACATYASEALLRLNARLVKESAR